MALIVKHKLYLLLLCIPFHSPTKRDPIEEDGKGRDALSARGTIVSVPVAFSSSSSVLSTCSRHEDDDDVLVL